jgi:V8-like Glu-specific endopeptidase
MALLDVEGVPQSDVLVLPLSAKPPADPGGERVYLGGYPAVSQLGVRSILEALLFPGGQGEDMTKRVSPGRLLGATGSLVKHDASTLGGSSGSPILSFDTHRVLGLHFNGRYGVENTGVALWTTASDPFFAGTGVAFG